MAKKTTYNLFDHLENKFPLRIHTIRTDRGHEFKSRFHCSVEGKEMRHIYIKRGSPLLNSKVERSQHFDQKEFYQLFSNNNDVVLNKKIGKLGSVL